MGANWREWQQDQEGTSRLHQGWKRILEYPGRGSWAEGHRKMDGSGEHKGDGQADEEVWNQSERCGKEGEEEEGAPW